MRLVRNPFLSVLRSHTPECRWRSSSGSVVGLAGSTERLQSILVYAEVDSRHSEANFGGGLIPLQRIECQSPKRRQMTAQWTAED
jgi:hypothetical protein